MRGLRTAEQLRSKFPQAFAGMSDEQAEHLVDTMTNFARVAVEESVRRQRKQKKSKRNSRK